ncbi:MAG: hypothetical protein L3K23_02580 [Thermoplasmata archaeon]|nr:hypothetical protein [Thermoplasmata archaeon]
MAPDVEQSIVWDGLRGRLGPGSFTTSHVTTLASGSSLELDGASIRREGDDQVFAVNTGGHDVQLTGSLSFDGGGTPRSAIRITGAHDIQVNLVANAMGITGAKPFVFVQNSERVSIGGDLRSDDASVIRTDDSSGLDISGVNSRLTADPGEAVVRVVSSSATTKPVRGIIVHDCDIDGGRVFTAHGAPGALINVSANADAPDIQQVEIRSIRVRNTGGYQDGIDVGRCSGTIVRDVAGTDLNCVVSVMGSNVEVSNVVGTACAAQVVAIGDPTYQTRDQREVLVRCAIGLDCGTGYSNPAGAGIGVLTTSPHTVSGVGFEECVSTRFAMKPSLYGVTVYPGADRVRLIRVWATGAERALLDRSDGGLADSSGFTGSPPRQIETFYTGPSPFEYVANSEVPEAICVPLDGGVTLSGAPPWGPPGAAAWGPCGPIRLSPGETIRGSFEGPPPKFLRILLG